MGVGYVPLAPLFAYPQSREWFNICAKIDMFANHILLDEMCMPIAVGSQINMKLVAGEFRYTEIASNI